jgi:hypothetical protein
MQHGVSEEARMDMVLIGSVPCKLPAEVQVDGRMVLIQRNQEAMSQAGQVTRDLEAIPKCTKIWMAEGHDVVELGHSHRPNKSGHGVAERKGVLVDGMQALGHCTAKICETRVNLGVSYPVF